MSGGDLVVFNVWFADARREDEPILFTRREDAQQYADLWEKGNVEELLPMGEGVAAGFIAEVEADMEAERE